MSLSASHANDVEEQKDDGRLGQYKNLSKHDELRRRRNECSVEIRKQKGVDLMMKRRNITTAEDEVSETELSEGEAKNVIPPARYSHQEVKRILSQNPSIEEMAKCFESLRRLLSRSRSPPIDEVIETGLLHALVQALSVNNHKVQYEAAWALTNIVSGTPEQTVAAVEAGATAPLVQLSVNDNEQLAEQALWAVANIAGDSAQLRDYVIKCHGVEALMYLVGKLDKLPTSNVRTLAWAFSNMCRHKNPHAPIEVLRVLSTGLEKLLTHTDRQCCQDAAWAVSYLTDGPDEQIELARSTGILKHIISYFGEGDALVAPALRTLGNVATGNDSLTQSVIELGTLQKVWELLEDTKSGSIAKEACWLISNIIAGTQSQIQAVIDAGLIPLLVAIADEGDFKSQFEASWAISNLGQGGTANQIYTLVQSRAAPVICRLLCSHSNDVVNNALEALYAMLLTVSNNFYDSLNSLREDIEGSRGLDYLERLQESESEKTYSLAYRIISEFFGDDDEAESEDVDVVNENDQPAYSF